jgi:hypothetical protein
MTLSLGTDRPAHRQASAHARRSRDGEGRGLARCESLHRRLMDPIERLTERSGSPSWAAERRRSTTSGEVVGARAHDPASTPARSRRSTSVTHRCQDFGMEQQIIPGDGVVSGHGRIHGRVVMRSPRTSPSGAAVRDQPRSAGDGMRCARRAGRRPGDLARVRGVVSLAIPTFPATRWPPAWSRRSPRS